jgi:hypothetical protein
MFQIPFKHLGIVLLCVQLGGCVAVAGGENAFIVALERFLLARESHIAELVNELGAL